MINLWKRIASRGFQFRGEVVGLIRGFQLLIVNLSLLEKLRPAGANPSTVIVDSWREAIILRLLWITQLLPRHKILVVRRNCDLKLSMHSNVGKETLLIVTSRAFIKHYQLLVDLRNKGRLVVL